MNSFIACTFSFKYEQVVMKCQTGYKSAILMQILFLCIKIIAYACIARRQYRKGKTLFRSYLQLKTLGAFAIFHSTKQYLGQYNITASYFMGKKVFSRLLLVTLINLRYKLCISAHNTYHAKPSDVFCKERYGEKKLVARI